MFQRHLLGPVQFLDVVVYETQIQMGFGKERTGVTPCVSVREFLSFVRRLLGATGSCVGWQQTDELRQNCALYGTLRPAYGQPISVRSPCDVSTMSSAVAAVAAAAHITQLSRGSFFPQNPPVCIQIQLDYNLSFIFVCLFHFVKTQVLLLCFIS